jgi:hypothetical protein
MMDQRFVSFWILGRASVAAAEGDAIDGLKGLKHGLRHKHFGHSPATHPFHPLIVAGRPVGAGGIPVFDLTSRSI